MAVRSGENDLTAMIDRAYHVSRVKCGPSDWWKDRQRGDTEVQDILEKCAKGTYGQKGKVFGAKMN